MDKKVIDRFWSKVEKTSDCWNFKGALRSGYGCMKIDGNVVSAHRLSWEIHFGKIPRGLLICHKCDNPKCVNPSHLFLGTYKENAQDALSKNRMIIPVGIRFKNNHYPLNTKIPKEVAIEIKGEILKRNEKLMAISKRFKVPYQYVRDISCGRILKGL